MSIRDLVKATVKHPGVRGGTGYYDAGVWKYGVRSTHACPTCGQPFQREATALKGYRLSRLAVHNGWTREEPSGHAHVTFAPGGPKPYRVTITPHGKRARTRFFDSMYEGATWANKQLGFAKARNPRIRNLIKMRRAAITRFCQCWQPASTPIS